MEWSLLAGSALVLLAVLLSPVARRTGAPILLVFLALGMLVGEDGPGGVAFNDFDLAYQIGSVALAVILFAGGLGTRVADIRVCFAPALTLATLGVVLTAAVVGLAVWLFGLSLWKALLLGAVVGSTDAAATFLLLQGRDIRLKGRVMETIVVESGLNDPMAIFLTIVLVGFVDAGDGALDLALAQTFALQLGLGAAAGLVGGFALAGLIRRLPLDPGLFAVLGLAGALALFAATQLAGGSGYLAIFLCGVLLMDGIDGARRAELELTHVSLAWLSQILMFLMLGLLVTPHTLGGGALLAALVALILILVARPFAVLVALAPFRYATRERVFIAWVGLRGAVPIFLAIIPVLSPGPIDVNFFNTVFLVVIASLVLQGWSIPWLARRLDLIDDAPTPAPAAGARAA